MSFWFKTTGIPLILFAVAAAMLVMPDPIRDSAGVPGAIAFLWLLVTAKMRRTYWSTRLRVRAARDERRADSRTS